MLDFFIIYFYLILPSSQIDFGFWFWFRFQIRYLHIYTRFVYQSFSYTTFCLKWKWAVNVHYCTFLTCNCESKLSQSLNWTCINQVWDYKTLRLYNPLCACPVANGNIQNLYVILPSHGFLVRSALLKYLTKQTKHMQVNDCTIYILSQDIVDLHFT